MLNDEEYLSAINQYLNDTTKNKGKYRSVNEDLFRWYEGDLPCKPKNKGQSGAVSNDCSDVVEADMPSLVRTFLGGDKILTFKPNNPRDPRDVQEAEEKTEFVHWVMHNQKNSFQLFHGWMKEAEIQKMAVVKYFYEELETVKQEKWSGLNQEETAALLESLEAQDDVESVEIVDEVDVAPTDVQVERDVTINIKRMTKKITIAAVPWEAFLISRNAETLDDAILVGDETYISKGELVAMGFPKEKIRKLHASVDPEGTTMRDLRYRDQGGSNKQGDSNLQRGQLDSNDPTKDWCTEQVLLQNLYMLIDRDQDGICERRFVMKVGQEILKDEMFDHVPYASLSAILMPHNVMGKSRVEITAETQREKSIVKRGMYNNIAKVNNPRFAVNQGKTSGTPGRVNTDDLLLNKQFGAIRVDGPVQGNILPIETPYVGDKALQIIQYIDLARAQTTGSLMASQGLNADALNKETATRFEGVQDEGAAKTELVMRVFAETGYRKLFEGLAWMAQRFQDSKIEIRVLGKELTFNPTNWRYEHYAISNVGLAAGDSQEMVENAGAVLDTLMRFRELGIPIADDVKIYNAYEKVLKALGIKDIQSFANNPERPDELLQLENQQLSMQVQQLTIAIQQMQQQPNPLTEAEMVQAESKRESDNKKLIIEQRKLELKIAELEEKARQFDVETVQKEEQSRRDDTIKLTELELEHQQDVPGSTV